MKTTNSVGLLQYLKRETAACAGTRPRHGPVGAADVSPGGTALRVPLEIDGALWSAVVERIADRSIALIVDREALGGLDDAVEGAIHFQPDNAVMQSARGQVTASDLLGGQRVRLNFELT